MDGIKYYKLMSPKYGGDTTKGCALTGAEVDGNFNFLRGYDIEKVEIVNNRYLKFTRVNGESLIVDLIDEEVRNFIHELDNRVNTLETKVETLSESSIDYNTRINQLELLVNQLVGQVAMLEEKVSELQDQEQPEFFDQRVRNIVDVLFDDDPQSVSFDRRLVNGKVVSMTPKWGSEVIFKAPIN